MKKFMVTQECDYVTGYLRYGHFEGIIEANSLEEAKKIMEEKGSHDFLSLVVDDYSVDDYDVGDNGYEFEEVD